MTDPLSTPILFTIFNRPDTTKIVFEKIRQIQPKYLYIAADGPRNDDTQDIRLSNECRNITNSIGIVSFIRYSVMRILDVTWPSVQQLTGFLKMSN